MGREDKRASGNTNMSKDDLKDEHARLVKREKELDEQHQNVQAIFQKLDQMYQTSKGTFSVSRYGQLKDMIKGATSDATLQSLQQVLQEASPENASGKAGLTQLLQKAKEFKGDAEQQTQQAEQEKAASGKKKSSFFKKLKDLTGFSDDPITDEDVMSESELRRDNGRKQRAIQNHINQITKALKKLEQLKKQYESSKSHAPPKRYQDLKDMIKAAVAT